MRVRPELNNRIRSMAGPGSPSQVVNRSFKEAMNEGTSAPSTPVKSGSGRVRYQPQLKGGHRRPQAKAITIEQAQNIAKHAGIISECSKKYGVPKELICAVIIQESGGKVRARSHAGAMGLMQLMPQTAKRFGVTDPYDPRQNIEAGTKYLSFLLKEFKGDYRLALAGYNAGEHRVHQYKGIPPFEETRNYVPSVLSYADTIWNILNKPLRIARADSPPAAFSGALPPHARKV